jgi:hypothetical protein
MELLVQFGAGRRRQGIEIGDVEAIAIGDDGKRRDLIAQAPL